MIDFIVLIAVVGFVAYVLHRKGIIKVPFFPPVTPVDPLTPPDTNGGGYTPTPAGGGNGPAKV